MHKVVCLCLTLGFWTSVVAETTIKLRKISQDSVNGMRPIETFELANGFTVMLWPDTGLKQVSLRMWYRVGALNETKGKTGLAHMFEHLMLRPSRFAPGGALTFERTMGADVAAYTRYKSTDYNLTVMPEKVDEVLRFYADTMKQLPLSEKLIELEKGAVESEFLQWENNHYMRLLPILAQKTFPNHIASSFVLGSRADVARISIDDTKKFYGQYYAPNNAVLIVTGAFNASDILKNIEEYFGPLETGRTSELPKDMVKLPKSSITKVKSPIPADGYPIFLTYPIPFHTLERPEDSAVALAFYVAFEGDASRVSEALVGKKKMAYYFTHDNKSLGFPFASGLLSNSNIALAIKAVDSAVDGLQKLEPADFKRYCAAYSADLLRGLQNATSRAFVLGHYMLYRQGVASLNADLGNCQNLSLTAFKKATKKYLNSKNRIAVVGVPERGAK